MSAAPLYFEMMRCSTCASFGRRDVADAQAVGADGLKPLASSAVGMGSGMASMSLARLNLGVDRDVGLVGRLIRAVRPAAFALFCVSAWKTSASVAPVPIRRSGSGRTWNSRLYVAARCRRSGRSGRAGYRARSDRATRSESAVGESVLRSQREREDRRLLRAGALVDERRIEIGRHVDARGVDPALHVDRRVVEVRVELELHDDRRRGLLPPSPTSYRGCRCRRSGLRSA